MYANFDVKFLLNLLPVMSTRGSHCYAYEVLSCLYFFMCNHISSPEINDNISVDLYSC
jgi:hypothetical protein